MVLGLCAELPSVVVLLRGTDHDGSRELRDYPNAVQHDDHEYDHNHNHHNDHNHNHALLRNVVSVRMRRERVGTAYSVLQWCNVYLVPVGGAMHQRTILR
jgi:ABC-type Zn2+ transport system substrate-binding protein/surface adhesin